MTIDRRTWVALIALGTSAWVVIVIVVRAVAG
jgi:hypothetical protein